MDPAYKADRPKECPPDYTDYAIPTPGTYAYKLLIRGMVPLFGGALQQSTQAPKNCKDQNEAIQLQMQAEMFGYAKTMNRAAEDTWKALNTMLSNVMLEGNVVTSLMVLPVEMRLLYLLAAIVCLIFLSVALVVGI